MDKLKDIKPIVEVNETSFYIFLIVVILCLIGSLFFMYKFIKWYKNRKTYIFNLDNSKETAYKLIKIIRDKEDSDKYIKKLHEYTYKKEVPEFDQRLFDEIIKKYKIRVQKMAEEKKD